MTELNQEIIDRLKAIDVTPDPDRPFVWKVGDRYITAHQLRQMVKVQDEREAEFKKEMKDD